MDGLLLVARLILAAVFLVAGITKLTNREATQSAVEVFGVPEMLAPPVSILLPLAELAVGIALIPAQSAWIGSLGALVLLGIFTAAVGGNLAMGRRPTCGCFGQLSASPIGLHTLGRNVVFLALGLFIAIAGHSSGGANLTDWLGGLNTSDRVALAVIIVIALLILSQWGFLYSLLQQNGRLLERMEELEKRGVVAGNGSVLQAPSPAQAPPLPDSPFGLPVGTPAPDFSLPYIRGGTVSLQDLLADGKSALLIFTGIKCDGCEGLVLDVLHHERSLSDRFSVAYISSGTVEENAARFSFTTAQPKLLVQEGNEVFESYETPGLPAAVVVDPGGTIGTPVFAGREAVDALVAHLVGPVGRPATGIPLLDEMPTIAAGPGGNGHRDPSVLHEGDAVPSLQLQTVDGSTTDLAEVTVGARTMLLFWNTACGYCQQMLPELRKWEKRKPKGSPQLVLLSMGPVEDIRALGLESPILLDPDFSVARRFGARGTPNAVTLDEEGKVASEVVGGAPNVFAMAR